MRNKIKHRKKYKIGKSPTPLGKITIVLVEIIREELELLTLIQKLQQVRFFHVVSEYDCVIGWLKKLGRWI